jgi:DNA-directed RNA polymerase II subunit RPB9
MAAGRRLRFCPETNDLLYPRVRSAICLDQSVGARPERALHEHCALHLLQENKDTRKLEFYCKNCEHVEQADPADWCVYASENTFSAKDKTVVMEDVIADPTLPRTKDVRCPTCNHNEAVFITASTEQGMTLFFNCMMCRHRWR